MSNVLAKSHFGRKPISMNMPQEVRAWCRALGVTEAQLRFAVSRVGESSAKVREYLKTNR